MSDDPYDKRAEAEKKKAATQRKIAELGHLYRTVFNTPDGRKVFRDLTDFCMTFQTTMTGNSWTYFNEGKRAVGLHILNMRELGFEEEVKQMARETYLNSLVKEE